MLHGTFQRIYLYHTQAQIGSNGFNSNFLRICDRYFIVLTIEKLSNSYREDRVCHICFEIKSSYLIL